MNIVRLALAAAPVLFVVACVDTVAGDDQASESEHLQALRDTAEPPTPPDGGVKTGPTSPPHVSVEQPSSEAAPDEESPDRAADLSASTDARVSPAFTGGGCTGAFPISACLSGSGSNVLADFYMNRVPDVTSWWYVVEVTRSNGGLGSWFSRQAKRLDHTGHYTVEVVPVTTLPVSHGCARTIIHVYDQNFNPHFTSTPSPAVCY